MNKIKELVTSSYAKIGSFITVSLFLPMFTFAASHQDPFGEKLGIDFEDGSDAGDAMGKFITNILWYVGVFAVIILMITAIYNIHHAMSMTRDEKEKSKSSTNIVFAVICVVLGLAISGLLMSGIAKVNPS